ncbi:MAG TPA: YqgE/AlgH family protein [Opitutales bacterium]|nr:YqgE/AlgH family protein [Opitutales bacterium]
MSTRLTDPSPTIAGSLLIAHPDLLEGNFHRTVVLVSAHSVEDGALGVIVNRPLGRTLGELHGEFAFGPLAAVQLYSGGPVAPEQMLLSAWHWNEDSGVFRLHFGISTEKAAELLDSEPGTEVRGFLGYAGWSGGQLEGELQHKAWVVAPIDGPDFNEEQGETLWKSLLARVKPELLLRSDAPEDPSVN